MVAHSPTTSIHKNNFISSKTHVLMSEEGASNLLDGRHLQVRNRLAQSATRYLLSKDLTLLSLNEPATGPNQAYLIIVTTATTGGGVPFSSRRTFFHREREMDRF